MCVAVCIQGADLGCVHDVSNRVEADDRTHDCLGLDTTKTSPEDNEVARRKNVPNALAATAIAVAIREMAEVGIEVACARKMTGPLRAQMSHERLKL